MATATRSVIWLSALCLAGCGSGHPATSKVTGKVLHGGQPVTGVTVSFVPEEGSSGRPASGVTDASGTYQLTTYTMNDGAVPGKYTVVVLPPAKAAPGGQDVAAMSTPDDYVAAMSKGFDPAAGATDVEEDTQVPQIYRDVGKSTLKKEVQAGSPNQFDLLVD